MTAHHDISPSTRILDANGYDWAWAFVWFKDIPGYPGYRAGSNGHIWSCRKRGKLSDRWRRLSPWKHAKGHLFYGLYRDNKVTNRYGHQWVLEAFVGPCPAGMECCHYPDPNPANNQLSNIRWDTRQANSGDCVKLGRTSKGESHVRAKLTVATVLELRAEVAAGSTITAAARQAGISRTQAGRIVRGLRWKHLN